MKPGKIIPAGIPAKNPRQRRCPLCDRVFDLAEARTSPTSRGRLRLHCPTPGCRGTPEMWVHPGNPLTSEEAWRDWERMLARWNRRHRDRDQVAA